MPTLLPRAGAHAPPDTPLRGEGVGAGEGKGLGKGERGIGRERIMGVRKGCRGMERGGKGERER